MAGTKRALSVVPPFLLGWFLSSLCSGIMKSPMASTTSSPTSIVSCHHHSYGIAGQKTTSWQEDAMVSKSPQEQSVSGTATAAKTTATAKTTPYGNYCNSTILGEKQMWNSKHKKILSYSVFLPPNVTDQLPKWVDVGIGIQAATAKLYYPDWILRLHAVGLSSEREEELLGLYDNVEIVRCERLSSSARMMMHRFLPLDDPSVQLTLVRDVDSRFSLRELMAVQEWMGRTAEYKFHVMRDHSHHCWPVMGGTFGMARGLFQQREEGEEPEQQQSTSSLSRSSTAKTTTTTMLELVDRALEEHKDGKIEGYAGEDQAFLALYVWPLVQNVTLAHDMRSSSACLALGAQQLCKDFPLGPRKQAGSPYFVGAQFKSSSLGPIPHLCFEESNEQVLQRTISSISGGRSKAHKVTITN